MNDRPQSLPPGWYPDRFGRQRWWDGQQFTERTRESEQQGQPASGKPKNPLLLGFVVLLVAVLGGAGLGFGLKLLDEDKEQTVAEEPAADESHEDGDEHYPDEFAERDAFFEEQQQPLDGSLLKSKTDAQKEFVAEVERQYLVNGERWDELTEHTSLTLALGACEASILNHHEIDADTALLYALSSPVIAELMAGASEAERIEITNDSMETAVLGVSYICPADNDDWQDALDEIDGNW